MATIKLREINPVVFNNNVGLGDVSPGERLVINSGSIKMDHANGGQGIFFQSLSASGNNSSLRWSNSAGTERFRLIVDPDSDKTDKLQINSNNNNTNCLTILQDGKVGIGTGSTAPTHKLEIKGPGSDTDVLNLHKGTGVGGLRFTFNGTNSVSYIRTYESSTLADNYMVFGVSQGDTTAGADVMRLMGDGKVGIGTGTSALDCPFKVKSADNQLADFHSTDTDAYIKIQDSNDSLYVGSDAGIGTFGGTTGAHKNNLSIDLVNGKVGIGTGSSEIRTELHVQVSDSTSYVETNPDAWGQITVENTDDTNGNYAGIRLRSYQFDVGISAIHDAAGNFGRLAISTDIGGSSAEESMSIWDGGNVGIGTGATLPAAKLDVYKQEGLLPVINARRGKDGGRIRLSSGSTTDNYGEIGMTSYSSGSKIWIGSNMNSFAATGHSSPAHADVDNATWFSAWDSNTDQYTIERIPNGQTAPAIMFSIDSDGRVNIPIANLPTSDTGLSAGDLYRSGTSLLIKTS